jgi:hypothetical protein
MQWDCNINTLLVPTAGDEETEKTGSGCCLRDTEYDMGGYCLLYQGSGSTPVYATYVLTEDNFASITLNDSGTMDNSWLVPYDINTTGFSNFYCEGVADLNGMMSCKKQQFWPAASWASGVRFEAGNKAMGYIQDKSATTVNTRWIDAEVTLLGAVTNLVATSTVVAFGLA